MQAIGHAQMFFRIIAMTNYTITICNNNCYDYYIEQRSGENRWETRLQGKQIEKKNVYKNPNKLFKLKCKTSRKKI